VTRVNGKKGYGVKEEEIDLIVIRSRKNGELGMAKPCSVCLPVIKDFGIRYVYYTNYHGYISRELAKDMKSTHLCASHLAQMRR
jgi:hypothetical protein